MTNEKDKSLAAVVSEGERLLAEATPGETPGEWRVRLHPEMEVLELTASDEFGEFIAISDYPGNLVTVGDEANFNLIVHLHNNASALLAAAKEAEGLRGENKKLSDSRSRLGEMNLAIRRTLESVGYKPATDEQGYCLKTTSVVEMVEQIAEWGRTLENVRNRLVMELEKQGYTNGQIDELLSMEGEGR